MKLRYQDAMKSEHWRSLRLLALARAGHRCEGMVVRFTRKGEAYRARCSDPEPDLFRCEATRGLQLHHLHYRTVGAESLGDVQVLCDRCHCLATILGFLCEWCGEPVCGGIEDAYDFLDRIESNRLRWADPTESLASLRDNYFGRRCAACDHVGYDPD